MNLDKLNADFDKWWASEEAKLPPMFSSPLSKQGLRVLTKIAFQQGVISIGEQLISKEHNG